MRKFIAIACTAAFVILCVHVAKTNVPNEQIKRITSESETFAKYCYQNDYKPKECR